MTTTALVKPGLRTIRLYGALAKIVGCRKLRAVVSSVSEAMRFLLANFPQIEEYLKGRFFKVKVANIALTEDDLKLPIGQTEEIHIIPAISGAGGNSGLTQILTGVALIGIGLLVPFTAPFLVPLGIGLTLTGIATLLTPTPLDGEESTDAAQSYNFSGIQQTSREGPPVPLVYGDIVTGSIVLSVNIERDDEELDDIFDPGPGDPTPGIPAFPNPDPNGCFRIKQVVDWGIRPECVDYYIQYPPLGIRTNIFNEQFSSIDITPVSVSANNPPAYFICQNTGTYGVMTTFNVVYCNSDNPTTRGFQAVTYGGWNYPASINYYRVYADGSEALIVELNYNVDYYGVYGPP